MARVLMILVAILIVLSAAIAADSNKSFSGSADSGKVDKEMAPQMPVCGDLNNFGGVTLMDYAYLANYLYNAGSTPPSMTDANVDGSGGVDNNDLQILFEYLYLGGGLNCAAPSGGRVLTVSSDTVEIRNSVVSPGNTTWDVQVWIKAAQLTRAFAFPFSFTCATSPLSITSIDFTGSVYSGANMQESAIDNGGGKGLIGIAGASPSIPTDGLVATVRFSINSSTSNQYILIDTTTYSPGNIVILSKVGAFYVPTIRGLNFVKFEVTNTDDDGAGSLRWAIDSVNNKPGLDTIPFAVSGTIDLVTPLSALSDDSTIILGSTAPGGAYSIVIAGGGLSSGSGLSVQSADNKIEGLKIIDFPGDGIEVVTAAAVGNTISNNIIYGNVGLALDLGNDGVTVNDVGDGDTGPNDFVNYPEIDSVLMNPDSSHTVWGSTVGLGKVEFFVAHPAEVDTLPEHPSGSGPASVYVGAAVVPGVGFSYTIPKTVKPFSLMTATFIAGDGNTSEFCPNFRLIASPLIIVAYSPVNLKVTDPDGFYIGKDSLGGLTQTLYPATYDEPDHDSIHIPRPKLGTYTIEVVKEQDAPTDAKYGIGIRIDGSEQCFLVINMAAPASGTTATYSYDMEEDYHYVNGDSNDNSLVNIQDITLLINFLYKSGPSPTPLWAGDANCNRLVNIQDITHLINFLYKSGPPPCNLP